MNLFVYSIVKIEGLTLTIEFATSDDYPSGFTTSAETYEKE